MKFKVIFFLAILIISLCGTTFAAKEGEITELTPVGDFSTSGDVQFKCVTTNVGTNKIPSKPCTLTITYGSSSVKSVTYTVPSLEAGESYTYMWPTTNVDFPYNSFDTGVQYEITASWDYPSGPATKTTQFDSIPSPWLFVTIAAILIAIVAVGFKKKSIF